MTPQLTAAEIERLREIVLAHDKKNLGGMKEFDLNNPPKEPYRYQEYPRCIYHHESGRSKTVPHEAALTQALSEGWRLEPAPTSEPEAQPQLSAAEQAEVAAIDAEARKPKKQK